MKFTVNTSPAQLAQVSAFLLSKGITIDKVRVHEGTSWQMITLTVMAAEVAQPEQPPMPLVKPKRHRSCKSVSASQKREIRALRESGRPVLEVARIVGVCENTVYRHQ